MGTPVWFHRDKTCRHAVQRSCRCRTRLATALRKFKGQDVVVLALPHGGMPVAAEIAAALHAPLDLILVRKIGAPMQPELAMGAVVDGTDPHVVRNEDVIRLTEVSEREFAAICDRELSEIERRRQKYLGNRTRAEIAGHAVMWLTTVSQPEGYESFGANGLYYQNFRQHQEVINNLSRFPAEPTVSHRADHTC